jgi:hypothetical protein
VRPTVFSVHRCSTVELATDPNHMAKTPQPLCPVSFKVQYMALVSSAARTPGGTQPVDVAQHECIVKGHQGDVPTLDSDGLMVICKCLTH